MKNLLHKFFFSKPKKVSEILGTCKKCGGCCQHINLCEAGAWVSNEKQFRKMVKEKPEYARLVITGKSDAGTLIFSCSWLDSNNQCKDYENRLDICEEFPNKMVIESQGEFPEGCGFTIHIHSSFDVVLKKTIQREKMENQWQRLKQRLMFSRKKTDQSKND